MEVLNKFEEDRPRNYHHYLPNLIDHGLRVQIMVGDRDYLCNWMGNEAWTMELNWRGAHEFRKAEVVDYHLLNEYPIGELRSYTLPDTRGQLTSIREVYGAGHDVAKDVPRAALKMVDEFLNNKRIRGAYEYLLSWHGEGFDNSQLHQLDPHIPRRLNWFVSTVDIMMCNGT